MNYEREISNLLRRLGVNNSYIGFRYTIYGVTRTAHDPTLLAYISKGLYVDIAVHYQTSIGCVERSRQHSSLSPRKRPYSLPVVVQFSLNAVQ